MPRPCTICSRADSAKINSELIAGTPVATVAAKWKVGDSSVRRHVAQHLSATLLQELRLSENLGTVDLLDRLVEALDDVSTVRSAALMAGRSDLVLKAATQTKSLVEYLFGVLGVDEKALLEEMRRAEQLAKSVAAVTRQVPAVGLAISSHLRERGEHELADSIEELVERASKALEEKATTP